MVADPGVSVNPTLGFTTTIATTVFVESKTLRAVTLTVVGVLTVAGAVYNPFTDIVPTTGDRLQVTP